MMIKSKPLQESQIIIIGGQTYIVPTGCDYTSYHGTRQKDIHANTKKCSNCKFRVSHLCSYVLATNVNLPENLPNEVRDEIVASSKKTHHFCSEKCRDEFIERNKHILIAENI